MASFRKINDKWRAEVCVNGKRKSKRFHTKGRAKAWADRLESDLQDGIESTQHTLADAFDKYAESVSRAHKGERWERVRLTKLKRHTMADMLITAIRPAHIASWRDARLQEVSAGSVRREMSLLAGVFSVARKEWGWIRESPMKDVSPPSAPQHRDRRRTLHRFYHQPIP